jgi:2-methylisocitrate lyase-like PEP mutase family enzyme
VAVAQTGGVVGGCAYQDAGAQRIFVWPLADELHQLERFREDVVPLVSPT